MQTTAAATTASYRIIARFRDGSAAYVSRSRKADKQFTAVKAQSLRLTHEEAMETVSRWHAVQAAGVYHQDVAFYDVVPAR